MKVRSLRGQLSSTDITRLIVDDGRLTHGYKVKEFHVWPDGTGADGVYATLGTQYDMSAGGDARDNRQIGWAGGCWSTTATTQSSTFSIVDPDHIVNQDLWIQATVATENTNYLIILEPVVMTEDQTIMQLIKERSQDDIR